MKKTIGQWFLSGPFLFAAVLLCWAMWAGQVDLFGAKKTVYETYSPYHHIRVIDQNGFRILSFNGSLESQVSINNPLTGHFEYIEYFHMPWLWNAEIRNVLVMGLGGGSVQRLFQHYHKEVAIETVELDPKVIEVAKTYFDISNNESHKITKSDGRLFLRRTGKKYDLVLMDAYSSNRYGSFIPYHLVTQEFFKIVKEHLSENGVVAYNVIGTLKGSRAGILGAVYKTMKSVFPQVYLFPATKLQNVVMVATMNPDNYDSERVRQAASRLMRQKKSNLPGFQTRLQSFMNTPPPAAERSLILIDDFSPVDGLLRSASFKQPRKR
ncbi:MAG TPA: hypothetical protein EYQ50_10705 [Verrucomicrobiales bacterium]|jgi:spermidine synthase|nr:hypothetical protein [Verrucomicrobiales bacterium]HIL71320.1 hypothetical protein [Verrucomicrobiota bacterium]